MRKTLVSYVRCTTGAEGAITVNKAYNATVASNGDGDYSITCGKGGAKEDNSVVEIETELDTESAVGSVPTLVSGTNTNTVKRVQFRNASDGVIARPFGFAVSIYRNHAIPAAT